METDEFVAKCRDHKAKFLYRFVCLNDPCNGCIWDNGPDDNDTNAWYTHLDHWTDEFIFNEDTRKAHTFTIASAWRTDCRG